MTENPLEELHRAYQEQRNMLADLQSKISEITVTAVSTRKEISVTVSSTGLVSDIKFLGSGYKRHSAKDLSALVMQTIAEAKAKAHELTAQLLAPLMPPGMDARRLMNGDVDVDAMAPPDGPRMAQVVREQLYR
jgi:DNA-binding protein YbaB